MNNWKERVKTFFRDPFGKKRVRKLRADLSGYEALNEILKNEAEDAARLARTAQLELNSTSMMLRMFKAQSIINREINAMLGQRYLCHPHRKALYHAVAKELDPDGVILFQTAQDILGKFEETTFPYEANHGFFEENILGNKGSFRALLIQYANKLGQPENPERWKPIQCAGGYEECTDWTIDETTPEYIEFEKELYARVFRYFYTEPVPFVPVD